MAKFSTLEKNITNLHIKYPSEWITNEQESSFHFWRLIAEAEAYRNKTNADIENEILKEIGSFPYLAKIEKVTVLDC